MELEITPEPTPEERAAILAALAALAGRGRTQGPGAWWEAGLRENVEDDGNGDHDR